MFKDKTIRKRIMVAIEMHIEEKQNRYNESVEQIDKEHEDTIKKLEEQKEQKKIAVADKLVAEIIGAILPKSNDVQK